MLSAKGYIIKKSNLGNHNVLESDIVTELTVKPKCDYTNNEMEEFCLCLETTTKLYLPKYYGLQKFGIPKQNKMNIPKEINIEFHGNLMKNQEEPVNVFLESANDPLKMGGILQLPPGYGKTVMALYIICKLRVKTLIIVHKEFLMNQWKERIEQYVPNVNVGIIKQKVIETENDIVIASLQSLCMKDYDEKVFEDFGFVIIDECHHIGAQVFSQALRKVTFKYSLGLSATVNRKDGLSKVFKWYIGDIIYKVKQKANVTCNIQKEIFEENNESYNKECTLYNGRVNISRMINNICNYKPRTIFIVNKIKELLEVNCSRNMIILSDRRNHLSELQELLKGVGIEDTGMYIGGMKNVELEKSKEKRIILGTFNMVSEGFDLPKLDTLILASPKSNIEQSVGRIQRKHEITELDNIPLVIDIVDMFSVFVNQDKKRNAFYKKMKYIIL